MAQGQKPPRAGWELPLSYTKAIHLSRSQQPAAPGAANAWLVCPRLLHTQFECCQVILLALRSDLHDEKHTQKGPLSVGLAEVGSCLWVMTAIRT